MKIHDHGLILWQLLLLFFAGTPSVKAVVAPWADEPSLRMDFNEHQFFAACREGRIDVVKHYVMQEDFNPDQMFQSGASDLKATCLFVACEKNYIELVRFLLLTCLVDTNQARSDGVTPLYIACQEGNTRVVDMLLSCGANPTISRRYIIDIGPDSSKPDPAIIRRRDGEMIFEFRDYKLERCLVCTDPYELTVHLASTRSLKKQAYRNISWSLKQAIANLGQKAPQQMLQEWRKENSGHEPVEDESVTSRSMRHLPGKLQTNLNKPR